MKTVANEYYIFINLKLLLLLKEVLILFEHKTKTTNTYVNNFHVAIQKFTTGTNKNIKHELQKRKCSAKFPQHSTQTQTLSNILTLKFRHRDPAIL